jgi:transposase
MMQSLLILLLLIIGLVNCPKVDPLRASITLLEQRAFIKCHVLLCTSAHDIHVVKKIAGRNAYSESKVYRIYHQFKLEGRLTCEDEPRKGRPLESTDEEHVKALEKLLEESRSWSTNDLAYRIGISQSSMVRLLKKLGLRKVASKRVPHFLKPEQKELRANISAEHLQRYEGDHDILNRIVAIDETWVKSYDPLDASHSREWRYPGEEP